MDISVSSTNGVNIDIGKPEPQIHIGKTNDVGIDLSVQPITLAPKKSAGVAFEFVQRVVAGSSVVRLTYDQFQALDHLDGSTWYAVTTTQDELRYLYLGATLVAQASQEDGTWGFAYTFPMTFGR